MNRFVALALCVLGSSACDSGPERPGKEPPPRPAAASSASGAGSSSAAASSSALAPALASAEPAAGVAGTWEGAFEATKGSVTLPEKVKDPPRDADDGKASSGSGKVKLEIQAGGEIKGSWTGALGKNTLSGRAEVEEGRTLIRTSAFPDEVAAADAMTGVLVGELKGDVIEAEIHVAGRDANVVREAKLKLERKK